ncbi:10 kDa chaperonin 1, chloroplastic [Lotus japonicus]|uniref:Uncharacterized protein n=1 Tax=Lotus japonicus TaxID=34305 RepID=I3SAR1_LOTJA|nr:10 kDa chaperonin 1, chloroplastic [Lotus japonicus]AFK37353.1 unknown [Lotus japonicus]AFK39467.1 unknown [Lotus japonicus]
MASTFVTLPTPFLHKTSTSVPSTSFSNKRLPFLKRNSLKVNAVATKWEPAKVVPQADRVLIRLEELAQKTTGGILLPKSAVKFERYLVGEVLTVGAEAGEVKAGAKVLFTDVNAYEVDLGTDAKHCFCKASDLLAVVE